MHDILRFRKLYELKKIYRHNSVEGRKESVAEHVWSALMLADYILTTSHLTLNRLRIYELLMYHDIVEIEAGDIPIHHEERRKNKQENEKKALAKLMKDLPKEIAEKLSILFDEFEQQKSPEAQFARAIDKLDATLHELDYKKDWEGWNEEMLRKYNEKATSAFPQTKALFEQLVSYAKKNNYFNVN